MLFESYEVAMGAFPQSQAIAIRQTHEHRGSNLCIQLIHKAEDGSHNNIHNYFSVNDPTYVEVPSGLDETKDFIAMHFNVVPITICYPEYIAQSDMHFPQGTSNIILRDCSINGKIVLSPGMQLTVEWVKKPQQTMVIST